LYSTRLLKLTKTAIKISNRSVEYIYSIAKTLFVFKANTMSKLLLISHLLLGEKTLRPAEGGTPNSFGKMGGNQWDALRASHLLASSKPNDVARPATASRTRRTPKENTPYFSNFARGEFFLKKERVFFFGVSPSRIRAGGASETSARKKRKSRKL